MAVRNRLLERKVAFSPIHGVSKEAQKNRSHEGMRRLWLKSKDFNSWATICGLVYPEDHEKAGKPKAKAFKLNKRWEAIHPTHRLENVRQRSASKSKYQEKLSKLLENYKF